MAAPDPTRLLIETSHLNDRLTAAGDVLVADLGLTSARWQVMGAVATVPGACTVSDVARAMGLTRQSVQRVVNDLAASGLMRLVDNPHHARAMLVELTQAGELAFVEASARRQPWSLALADGLAEDEVRTALKVVKALNRALVSFASAGSSARSD